MARRAGKGAPSVGNKDVACSVDSDPLGPLESRLIGRSSIARQAVFDSATRVNLAIRAELINRIAVSCDQKQQVFRDRDPRCFAGRRSQRGCTMRIQVRICGVADVVGLAGSKHRSDSAVRIDSPDSTGSGQIDPPLTVACDGKNLANLRDDGQSVISGCALSPVPRDGLVQTVRRHAPNAQVSSIGKVQVSIEIVSPSAGIIDFRLDCPATIAGNPRVLRPAICCSDPSARRR